MDEIKCVEIEDIERFKLEDSTLEDNMRIEIKYSELKPCPFCSSKAIEECIDFESNIWNTGCEECQFMFYGYGVEEAAKRWNTRYGE